MQATLRRSHKLFLRHLRGNPSSGASFTSCERYDIAIVGCGMVGYGLAALAATSPILKHKRTLLIENQQNRTYKMKDPFAIRVVAISPASRRMMEAVGAWDFIAKHRLQPVKKMKVWEKESEAFLTFQHDPLAYIIENDLISEAFKNTIAASNQSTGNAEVVYCSEAFDFKLPTSKNSEDLVRFTVRDKTSGKTQNVETKLLVGADGYNSLVRKAANLSAFGWGHGQSAVVATLNMGERHEPNTAWQRFVPSGPIALLPLSENYSSLTWSTTNSEAEHLMNCSEEQFVHELNEALTIPCEPTSTVASSLGRLTGRLVNWATCTGSDQEHIEQLPIPPHIDGLQTGSRRACFPLGFQHVNCYATHRVALIGDAAHRILPLAGQGVNLGFGDAISLKSIIESAASNGADIGSGVYLRQYTADRQRGVVPVAASMEALNLLYSTGAFSEHACGRRKDEGSPQCLPPPLSLIASLGNQALITLRAAGVHALQNNPTIKSFFTRSAVEGRIRISSK